MDGFDVVIVGAGNAAMSAAHAALDRGATVCILEKAPKEDRGGNSALTGHFRFVYENLDDLFAIMRPDTLTDAVRERFAAERPSKTQDDVWDDIMTTTGGLSDPEMLQVHVERSYDTMAWLRSKGHMHIPSPDDFTGDGTGTRLDGGGEGLMERNFEFMESRSDVTILYETTAQELLTDADGRVIGVKARTASGITDIYGGAVVLAAGGFEANAEMRTRYLGPLWDSIHLRGVPYNTGDGLRMALDIGAMPHGGWGSAHAAPVDWAMPKFSSISLRRRPDAKWIRSNGQSRYIYAYAIMVNTHGERFMDEAEGTRDQTYASIGRGILAQPGSTAFQIIDAGVREKGLLPQIYDNATGVKADTLEELAVQIGVDPAALRRTVDEFNAAVPTDREAVPSPFQVDGVGTIGLRPPKSNFAMVIDKAPFEAFQVRCGMTFTFGGLKIVPETAQVVHTSGDVIPGLYCAGEMAGGLFYWNYPSGSGLMAGATFGRIAGDSAALAAKEVAA